MSGTRCIPVLFYALALSAAITPTPVVAAVSALLSPTSGPPTTSLTVTGKGFDPSTAIDVFFDQTAVALATSNGSGTVKYTFAVSSAAQPGRHWVTLIERRNSAAVQAAFAVSTNWPQTGWGPSKRSFNPFENTINTSNVSQLTRKWSRRLDGFGNSKPLISMGNTLLVRDANQVARAFDTTGKLLWTATTPFSTFPDALTPAAYQDKVFFSDLNGNVIAYKIACRSDGGTCAPSWSKSMGAAAGGGVTLRGGRLYVPAADGKVHVFGPALGAAGTSITAASSALTTWIAFASDGSGSVGYGAHMVQTPGSSGSSSDFSYGGTLSNPAVGAGPFAYSTGSDNYLHEMQFGWATALAGSSCGTPPPPAFAAGVVYAAGCTSIGAYDVSTGNAFWTATISGGAQGLTVANGILYACVGSRLRAYAAGWGQLMWSGGGCSAAPIVVNGVLYATYATLDAYTLNAVQTTAAGQPRPDPRSLIAH